MCFKPKMTLDFLGLVHNSEGFTLKMSSSVHGHLAPDLASAVKVVVVVTVTYTSEKTTPSHIPA